MLWVPLLGAARLGSVFGPGALTGTLLVLTLAGALVAAVLLPRLLQAFCDFELGLGAAFAATLGRSLAAFAVSMAFVATSARQSCRRPRRSSSCLRSCPSSSATSS